MGKITLVEYLHDGVSVFEKWFITLDAQAAAKVATALYRVEQGNFSNIKPVGKGVSEYKIDFGPGVQDLFCSGGRNVDYSPWRRFQKNSEQRY